MCGYWEGVSITSAGSELGSCRIRNLPHTVLGYRHQGQEAGQGLIRQHGLGHIIFINALIYAPKWSSCTIVRRKIDETFSCLRNVTSFLLV